jgi:predicted aldo/keto reductase-like oxidoreductase
VAEVHGADWLDTWETGIPNWEDVPGEINIWEIVRLWTYAKALDTVEFAKMRYNLLGNAGHWFPGRNADALPELDLAPCLAHSPHRDRILAALEESRTWFKDEPKKRLSESD